MQLPCVIFHLIIHDLVAGWLNLALMLLVWNIIIAIMGRMSIINVADYLMGGDADGLSFNASPRCLPHEEDMF